MQYISIPSNDVSIIYQISPSAKLITKCNLQNSSAVYLGSESKVSKHRAKNATKHILLSFDIQQCQVLR